MFNLLNVVSRAEQSRASYNLQTEEFRSLNANLQTYLGDIKTIDDENRQLQESIEQIQRQYISTLEDNLKHLPNDFRNQSQILTNAHLERYRLKSRTRRFLNEREELKRRVQFVAMNEKDQMKSLNRLQKQERSNRTEFEQLNEQFQRLVKYVESEKQIHRQAMEKVDDLQIQLEQICIERSRREFEVQTLKEEVQLMQNTKEFLSEERETILSTQTEANEYLLSRLNESIVRIRDDFDQLNQTQIQQIENDYKQIIQTLEENLLSDQPIDTSEHEQIQNEHQIVLKELTQLNDHHQILSQRILGMETDFYSLRNERMQQLMTKDNELEQSKMELQTLNEKLNHLAEYDRNLKFELTLYRGVLESEYRRKQSANKMSHLSRPTTLRTNNNNNQLSTDRRIWLTNRTNQSKFNDQQEDEILTTQSKVQSGEDGNVQIDDVVSTTSPLNDEKSLNGETLWRQLIEPFNQAQQEDRTSTNINLQKNEKPSRSASTTTPVEQQRISPTQTSSINTETQKSPTLSISSKLQEDLSASPQRRSLPTPPERRSSPTTSSSSQKTSPTNATPFAFEVLQSSSTSPQQPSPRTPSINARTFSEGQRSPTSPTIPTATGEQQTSFQTHRSPSTPPQEHQPSSRTSSTNSKTALDLESSPFVTTTAVVSKDQSPSSGVQQSSTQENRPSSRTSSISSKTSLDFQPSPTATTPVVPEHKSSSTSIYRSPSIPSQEHQPSSRTSSTSSKTAFDLQKSPLAVASPTLSKDHSSIADIQPSSPQEYQPPSPGVQQSPTQDNQPSARTSSISSKTSLDLQKSPTVLASSIPEYQPSTFNTQQSFSQEDRPSSRSSSISSKPSSNTQKFPLSPTTPTTPELKSSTSDLRQLPSTSLEHHQTFSSVQQSSATAADDYQIKTPTDDFGDRNPSINSFVETDDNVQYEDSTSYTTDDKVLSEVDHTDHHQSFHSIEPSPLDDFELPSQIKSNRSRSSSSLALTSTAQEQTTANLLQLDQREREEEINSSLRNQTEENHSINNISSTRLPDHHLNDPTASLPQDTNKPSSDNTSLTDVEEVDLLTSPKLETQSDDNDDPNLAIIMQDLRHVFHEIVNDEDLVEIDNDLPNKILDRLELHDHFIRTLFDSLLRKYLIQPAADGYRDNKLDWIDFRDLLFPIITGRYTERQIRKLFDLLDISGDGYLSLQEIAELLEVLHANDTIDFAQNIIDEFDTDHDGKLNIDELIEAMKSNDNMNERTLAEEIESEEWFYQSPIENQTITFEVPIINFPLKTDDRLTKGIPLLGRIFRNVGATSETKQLDSRKKNLSMQIADELINNDVNIASEELQLFVQLYLDKQRDTDSLINWSEFRDHFLPVVNDGYYSKNDVKRWFEIFDTNQNGIITPEQIRQLACLFQIQNIEEILDKLSEITDDTGSWTLDELIFILDSDEESASHLLTNTEQIASFDNDWLSDNIF